MNEAQTLIDLEKFMSLVCKRDYHWKDFASDYEQWLDDARTIYDEELEYSPLLQAYFDLIPERMDWYDQEVFENRRAFSDFQKNLKIRQQSFLNDFTIKVEDNLDQLFTYFDQLVAKHCKLLLVRVDLYYLFERSPSIWQFDRDVKKLINRIQNRDTIFKDQVGYVYRLEQGGKSKGYHCHLLVIYNGSDCCRDSYYGQEIGKLWQDEITRGRGYFHNGNHRSHKKYYESFDLLGIGRIDRKITKHIENAHTAIRYLAKPKKTHQYLRVRLYKMREFSKAVFKPSIRSQSKR
ncbi:hypothetical protein F900_02053 [Acinetobacter modestus]|uniref:Inovirus Gp2 family protein n=1 Tax=Acinetobacter modestus TaxID=1776740 RepID=N9LVL2_9GAMM|nr:inovirus-type Gp2 protein [Acinetobacter modestus]ENX00383.1 hypothetical protein F900_02053 [Acinetobacter modestus]